MSSKKTSAPKQTQSAPATANRPAAIKERFNKTQLVSELAEKTSLAKPHVSAVLDELGVVIERHLVPRGIGEFVLPSLLKIKRVNKPAQKAKKNVPNPFRPGELMDVAAKPASTAVKIQPLKNLKDMAAK